MSQREINKAFHTMALNEGLLPVKVTPFYKTKIREEVEALGHHLGPLHRVAFPTQDRISLRTDTEVNDFVGDRLNAVGSAKGPVAIKKYADRILFLVTSRCFGHCQYCFRTSTLSGGIARDLENLASDKLNELLELLRADPSVTEVILSGGDPLTISPTRLEMIIEGIRSVASVRSIRVHTRAIVYEPRTFDEGKVALLARHNIRVVFHIVHPYEICQNVSQKVAELRESGVRLYNQFPLLRNINDHPLVLCALLEKLDEIGVRNLSIFIPDPIDYSAAFRVRLNRVWQIADQLNIMSPSWINSTRFVFDSRCGKVRRENYIKASADRDFAFFLRGGNQIRFPDFPEHLDIPGSIDLMLWKESLAR